MVRIEQSNGDGFLSLMDTGFNGEIFLTVRDALMLGFTVRDGVSSAQLANGQNVEVQRGFGVISWLGRSRRVEVMATKDENVAARLPDDPVALVGTALLSPHLVLIDFSAGRIEIEDVD